MIIRIQKRMKEGGREGKIGLTTRGMYDDDIWEKKKKLTIIVFERNDGKKDVVIIRFTRRLPRRRRFRPWPSRRKDVRSISKNKKKGRKR